MYTWRVHRKTCEACRVLEAESQNDREGKTPRRGVKYAVLQETDHGLNLIGG
jgi:hypothetical protein